MTTKPSNSNTSGLSPEDVALLAEAEASVAKHSTRPTSDYWGTGSSWKSKAISSPAIEPNSLPSANPIARRIDESISAFFSPQTIGQLQSIPSATPGGLSGTASSTPSVKSFLPTGASERKKIPLYSGLVKYFPDALVAVAALSYVGNQQHNADKPLHWDRAKSTDQEDTLLRHLFEAGTVDVDGVRHSTKVAWRALALLQLELEKAK